MRRTIVATFATALLLAVSPIQAVEPRKEISKKEAMTLAAKAHTKVQHQELANFFRSEANLQDQESKEHAMMAKAYEQAPAFLETKHPMAGKTAAHCRYFSERYAEMAKKSRELAEFHTYLAEKSAQ